MKEPRTIGERLVIGVLRLLLPPHPDNEAAAEFLRTQVGQTHAKLQWAAVRPDKLIDEEEVTPYNIHPSPLRSPIFNAGETSRINVANFMCNLLTDEKIWNEWKGQMPIIYNEE